MKKYAVWMLSLLLLAACGSDSKPPTGQGPGGSQPPAGIPAGSKWSASEWTSATTSCADSGAKNHPQHSREKWLSYCTCVYAAVAPKYTLRQFADNFESIYAELVNNRTDSGCLRSAGISP